MKVALIRCLKQEEDCIAKDCLDLIKQRKNQFAELGKVELVGLITCGDCPGKKISIRAKKLLQEKADKVILTSCILKGSCRDSVCPHHDQIKNSLLKTIEQDKLILSTL